MLGKGHHSGGVPASFHLIGEVLSGTPDDKNLIAKKLSGVPNSFSA